MQPKLPTAGRLTPNLRAIDVSRAYTNFEPLALSFKDRLAARFGMFGVERNPGFNSDTRCRRRAAGNALCEPGLDLHRVGTHRSRTGLPIVIDVAAGFDAITPCAVPAAVSLHATKALVTGEGASS